MFIYKAAVQALVYILFYTYFALRRIHFSLYLQSDFFVNNPLQLLPVRRCIIQHAILFIAFIILVEILQIGRF